MKFEAGSSGNKFTSRILTKWALMDVQIKHLIKVL